MATSEIPVPDITWSCNDQIIQEILSEQKSLKQRDDIYETKKKWYHDHALLVAPYVGCGTRFLCNFYETSCLTIFLLYFTTLVVTVYKNQLTCQWPSHGYIMDMLTYWRGSTEKLPYYAGRISDLATLLFNHFVLFYLSFIFIHILCT